MIYTILGSFCSSFNWEGSDIQPQIGPRKIPALSYHLSIFEWPLKTGFTVFTGQSVPEDEQYDMRRSVMEETPNVTPATSMIGSLTGSLTNISDADKAAFEAEKLKVYQQLDDKVLYDTVQSL